jgi:glycosyltransferase involved in cell wall biosynthesis
VPSQVDVIIPGEALPAGIDASLAERLAACARRDPSAATVSVYSTEGPLAYRATLAAREIDALFAAQNPGVHLEIPCALPPCVYITERALGENGRPVSWDAQSLVDFCARASEAGFRHLLAANAYAGAERPSEGFARWNAAVDARPELRTDWREFELRAPAVPPRRRVDLARLRTSRRPRILFVTHDWGGGVELHVNDLARLLAEEREVLVLRPGIAGTTHVRWLREGESLRAWFDTSSDWSTCVAFLASLGIARVHFHHVHGLPKEALALPAALGVPYDVTLHDHFAICPQYHLADPKGAYCGEPDEHGCDECISGRPAQWGLDIREWRALFRELLAGAGRVIAPSADIGARVQRYFPEVQAQIWPHPEMRSDPEPVHKVLLLGGLSAIKGMDLFEACVRDASARALPLHFHVIGHLSRPLQAERDARVTIHGTYSDARLAELVELARPDAFLFLSQVPESYSYTLSTAMQSGKPIVATHLGAFVERLRGYPTATLVAHDADARTVNDALLRLVRVPAALPRAVPISVHRA